MHAIIALNAGIRQVLRYHQQKLIAGHAETIAAENFIHGRENLALSEAQYHFDRLSSLNRRVTKNVLHIFLSFDERERIDNGKMAAVASDYLEGMGFQEQPWLAYRHYDSVIPHAHLVTSTVREDGIRLEMKKHDLHYSRELTHALEDSYGLNKSHRQTLLLEDQHTGWEKVQYGEKPLYPSMNRVLEDVIPNYAYSSLDELNAVLSLHNLRADQSTRHGEGAGNGLFYRPLSTDGTPLNVSINASVFPSKPTWVHLEDRFAANQLTREPARSRLATAIDWCLTGSPLSLSAFKEAMSYEGVSVVYRQAADGSELQNCLFIDHNSRCVFEGAALGEAYSPQQLAGRCISEEAYRQQQTEVQSQTHRQSLHL